MKYDDASWHYEGDFPPELPKRAGATHIGMFVAWLIDNRLASDDLTEDHSEALERLAARQISGATFVLEALDGKLTNQDLSDEGNAFTLAYYQGFEGDGPYFDDYFAQFDVSEATMYGVEDSWENYAQLALKVDGRYENWKASGRPKFLTA